MSKKFEEPAKGGLPGWMGTYGDLVTLLLCFFILMFSMSSVDATKYKAVVESFGERFGVMPGGDALTGGELIIHNEGKLSGLNVETEYTTDPDKKPTEADNTNGTIETPTETSITTNDTSQYLTDAELMATKTGKIAQEIQSYLKDSGVSSAVMMTFNSNYIKLTLSGEMLFDAGKAALKPEAAQLLTVIKDMIIEKKYTGYLMQIEGHTDNLPIHTSQFPSNWYLSSARAIAVGEWLIANYKFDPKKISCTGYGEHNPISTNDTNEGRAQNRRVEIKLIIENETTDSIITP